MRCCKACGCYLPDGVFACLACGFDERKARLPRKERQRIEIQPIPDRYDVEVFWKQDDDGVWYGDVVQTARDMQGNILGRQVLGRKYT